MDRRTLALLTWITVVAAVVSAAWLAADGAAVQRFGVAPLVLGRPMPATEDAPPPARSLAPRSRSSRTLRD